LIVFQNYVNPTGNDFTLKENYNVTPEELMQYSKLLHECMTFWRERTGEDNPNFPEARKKQIQHHLKYFHEQLQIARRNPSTLAASSQPQTPAVPPQAQTALNANNLQRHNEQVNEQHRLAQKAGKQSPDGSPPVLVKPAITMEDLKIPANKLKRKATEPTVATEVSPLKKSPKLANNTTANKIAPSPTIAPAKVEEPTYPCNVCGAKFKTESDLAPHLTQHQQEAEFRAAQQEKARENPVGYFIGNTAAAFGIPYPSENGTPLTGGVFGALKLPTPDEEMPPSSSGNATESIQKVRTIMDNLEINTMQKMPYEMFLPDAPPTPEVTPIQQTVQIANDTSAWTPWNMEIPEFGEVINWDGDEDMGGGLNIVETIVAKNKGLPVKEGAKVDGSVWGEQIGAAFYTSVAQSNWGWGEA
jgi:hypothetical protein